MEPLEPIESADKSPDHSASLNSEPEGELLKVVDQFFAELQTNQTVRRSSVSGSGQKNSLPNQAKIKLSSEYPFEESTIQSVYEILQNPAISPIVRIAQMRRKLAEAFHGTVASVLELTDRPVPLLIASTLAVTLFLLFSSFVASVAHHLLDSLITTLAVISMISTIVIQGFTVYRHHKLRFAVIATCSWWIVISIAFTVATFRYYSVKAHQAQLNGMSTLELFIAIQFASALFTAMIAVLFGSCSLFGSYMFAKRLELLDRRRTRTELLRRYLELRERLKRLEVPKQVARKSAFAQFYQHHVFLFSFILGLFYFIFCLVMKRPLEAIHGGTYISLHGNALSIHQHSHGNSHYLNLLLVVGSGGIAFLSAPPDSAKKALRSALAAILGCTVGYATVAILKLGLQISEPFSLVDLFGWAVLGLLLAGTVRASIFGAKQARWHSKLERGDTDALVIELAKLRGKLNIATQESAILSVDAAKSTLMKSGEDPITTELVFREYQDWMSLIATQNGGRVHSTAGDGAIIAFQDVSQAYHAAKKLQTDLDEFNLRSNRLKMPFRIRIGIHSGEMLGQVDDVVFTSVIDVAAHIEPLAPVGGIAVSEPTYRVLSRHIPNERFALMSETVDGFNIYVAINTRVEE